MKEAIEENGLDAQVTFRIQGWLREFYEKQARKERRDLSDMFRIALEDHAKQIQEQQ